MRNTLPARSVIPGSPRGSATGALWLLLAAAALPLVPFEVHSEEATEVAIPAGPEGMVRVEGGVYQPLYALGARERATGAFYLDADPVTNSEFLEFVREHPQWRRSRVARTLADENYLRHWAGDLEVGGDDEGGASDAPVTNVSWFAAKAFCETQGRRLPTSDEWEFAARADATKVDASRDPEFLRKLLEWYARPTPSTLPPVASAETNVHGIRGMHGLVWEWVADFNSAMIVGDSRGDDSLERSLFCGAGSLLSTDVGNYAAYMRHAFRSSLQGSYCVRSLGFRAARSISAASPDAAAPGPPVSSPYDLGGRWTTQHGDEISLRSLRGRVRVLTMGFTSCQYACPRIVGDMQRIESALGPRAADVGFVFVTIDPRRDTPEVMAEFAAGRQLDPRRWTFLQGAPDSIRELAVALDFKYQQIEEDFAHSNVIAVIDEDGTVVHRETALGADIRPSVEAVLRQRALTPGVSP